MPSLSDILAAKKAQASAQGEYKQEELPLPEATYIPAPVNETLFFSVYSILLRYPYEIDIQSFRELRNFLLADAQYVLNTFPQMSEDWLFNLLLRCHPPRKASDLHTLYLVICELRLCVPASYINSILYVLTLPKKIFCLQNF